MSSPFQTVAFQTLGCKLNFAETSTIARDLIEHGFSRVDIIEKPDVVVINTCSVTDNADKKARKAVRNALQYSPEAYVAIVGCYSQLKPSEISQIPGVDLVLGNAEKFDINQYISTKNEQSNTIIKTTPIEKQKDFIPSYSHNDRVRSFLKIQDGCDYPCTYCTIPMARGNSRSDTIKNTISLANSIANSDIKEIVLTGVNIGDFGVRTGESFFNLIKQLDEINGISRFRISSIEPNLLTDEIVDFIANSNSFLSHFHIPLQSGSDKTLKAMQRRYTTKQFMSRVEKIKSLLPDACIATDVIVGFPGETESNFKETLKFIEETEISYCHVFSYSERKNTPAQKMNLVISKSDRLARSKSLRFLSDKMKINFYNSQLTQVRKVLVENCEDGICSGLTDNYVRVQFNGNNSYINTIQKVNLESINGAVVSGELVK